MGATPKTRSKGSSQAEARLGGVPIPAPLLYLIKRPAIHVALVMVFLFATTVLVDPLAGAVRTAHVPETSVSWLSALRDLVTPVRLLNVTFLTGRMLSHFPFVAHPNIALTEYSRAGPGRTRRISPSTITKELSTEPRACGAEPSANMRFELAALRIGDPSGNLFGLLLFFASRYFPRTCLTTAACFKTNSFLRVSRAWVFRVRAPHPVRLSSSSRSSSSRATASLCSIRLILELWNSSTSRRQLTTSTPELAIPSHHSPRGPVQTKDSSSFNSFCVCVQPTTSATVRACASNSHTMHPTYIETHPHPPADWRTHSNPTQRPTQRTQKQAAHVQTHAQQQQQIADSTRE
ncbi:hypothetical protein FVE85_1884 [Porphyridium purpureum]|uniref:Uncharacterized protein n=1 Tax=Porphyridium purpureum TaxID=35688 RepID=A0A5J4YW22_PORPP|nr:hypothetical protein FVE85_1884 [Porphyridium purpureum]|eukprot:POR3826..scf209_3